MMKRTAILVLIVLAAIVNIKCGEDSLPTTPSTPDFTISTTHVSVTEGGATATFTIKLNRAPAAGKQVRVNVTGNSDIEVDKDGGASFTTGTDFWIFTPSNWTDITTIKVRALDNGAVDGTRTGTIVIAIDPAQTTDTSFLATDIPDVSTTAYDND